jgi:isopenicillin N synthase-like dioxygenase
MSIQSVPTIDIGPLLSKQSNDTLIENCVKEIRNACLDWGFFYIENHGISEDLLGSFRSDMDTFFHLPQQVLDPIRRNEKNSRGYFDDELTKNKLDWKRCFDVGAQNGSLDNEGMDGWNQWPSKEQHGSFETTIRTYFHEMEELSAILLRAICRSLDFEPDTLQQHFVGNHTSYLRLNYYPKCPDPSSTLAVHHHTDAGALTILYQDDDVTSLQVHKDSQWHFIPPRKGTFVINIGDMIQVWSNDKYKAPLHQVQANASTERYSAPFFYNPSYESNVFPLVQEGEETKYKTINWGEFRVKRFAGDYADLGEEVQISHYYLL